MWDPSKFDGLSIGIPSDGGTVFKCVDFKVERCCNCCHANGFILAVYPWSCFSTSKRRMPDLGFGMHAEICRGMFNIVRLLPRDWWIYKYAQKEGWTEQDAARLAEASPEKYYKTWGEIRDSYVDTGPVERVSAGSLPRKAPKPPKFRGKCSKCGTERVKAWCEKCGYAGPPVPG